MIPAKQRTTASVERLFQFSMAGLVGSAFFALAGAGRLDRPSLIFVIAGLVLRVLISAGRVRFELPARAVTAVGIGFLAFYPLDYYVISRDLFVATSHGVCLLGILRVVNARTNRDYLYTGAVAFLALVGAAVFSGGVSFFLWLGLFLIFAIAAFTSGEIRSGMVRAERVFVPAGTRMAWRLGLVTATAACGLVFLTAAFFLLVPRTARATSLLFPNLPRRSGFTSVVDLGRFGSVGKDDRPVMHVLSYTGPLPEGMRWRGTALSYFDGQRWLEIPEAVSVAEAPLGPVAVADPRQRSRRDGARLVYRADVADGDTGVLFIAGIPEFVNVQAKRLVRTVDDSFHVEMEAGDGLRYEISAENGTPLSYPVAAASMGRYLALPAVDKRIPALAHSWGGDGSDYERALRIQAHLQSDFQYRLEVSNKRVQDPLANFLFVAKHGYCEYFASAMVVMLRTQGIPSRVVTGFLGGYYNDLSQLYVIRASDAHAWVEGWIAGRGWVTFDPTPFGTGQSESGVFSRLSRRAGMYLDAADSTWQQWVVSWSLGRQADLAVQFQHRLQSLRTVNLAPGAGVLWGGLLLLLLSGVGFAGYRYGPRLRRRRAARSLGTAGEASVLYERMLERMARRGFQKPVWFTPLEFARHLPSGEREMVSRFTAAYNAARFGGEPGVGELREMLAGFEDV